MGLQASIDITYSKDVDFASLLELLLNNGWSYNDNGKITFMSNDNYDWEDGVLTSFDVVFNKLKHRFSNNQVIGIALLNVENIGATFHFMPNKREMMMLLNINRKKIPNSNQTDFTFYAKILTLILGSITAITYTDVT